MYTHSKRFIKEYVPAKKWIYFWGIISLLLTIALSTTVPLYIKDAVNLLKQDTLQDSQISQLHELAITILVIGLSLCVFRTLSRVLIFLPGRQLEATLRQDLFDSVVSLPQNRLERFESGDLISRGTNDISSVRVMISMGILHSINSTCMISACLYFMLNISVKMTLLSLIPLPIVILVTRYLSKQLIVVAKQVQESLGRLTERIREQFRAHSMMRIYPVFDILHEKFETDNDNHNTLSLRQMLIRTYMLTSVILISSFGIYILIRYGGEMAINNEGFDVGSFVTFSLYLTILLDPLRALGWLLSVLQRGEVCLERFYEIKDEAISYKAEQIACPIKDQESFNQSCQVDKSTPIIEAKDLSFAYSRQLEDSDIFSLSIAELKIEEGKKYGFFGKTGSGKSTLLKLLSNSLLANSGSISFRGTSFQDTCAEVLSQQFSVVPQECRHFSGTLKDNLDLAQENIAQNPLFTANSFEEAYETSCLKSDVEKLSKGFDTILGEHGINLSGGQRQRLAIMRALLRPRQVLIMDDFVSAVDHKTEKEIIEKLYQNTKGQTALLSSHRISALQECDKIFIIADGTIVDSGNHEELLKTSRFYSETWDKQLNAENESTEFFDV